MSGATAAGLWATSSAGVIAASLAELAAWWRDSFHSFLAGAEAHTPALLMILALIVSVPILAVVGLGLRKLAAGSADEAGLRDDEHGPNTARIIGRACRRPETAWLEMEGRPDWRFAIDRELVRIGGEHDNDIRLDGQSVQRYHAVVQRSMDAELVITDVSSTDGNGLVVNGRRLERASLVDGDRVEVGGTVFVVGVGPGLERSGRTASVDDVGPMLAERAGT